MPRSRDTLQRFRPAGTPGAASAAGIPVDRVAEASAELEPVLSLLADTQAEVAGLRRAAEREAEQRRQAAVTRATALIAAAHRQATARAGGCRSAGQHAGAARERRGHGRRRA